MTDFTMISAYSGYGGTINQVITNFIDSYGNISSGDREQRWWPPMKGELLTWDDVSSFLSMHMKHVLPELDELRSLLIDNIRGTSGYSGFSGYLGEARSGYSGIQKDSNDFYWTNTTIHGYPDYNWAMSFAGVLMPISKTLRDDKNILCKAKCLFIYNDNGQSEDVTYVTMLVDKKGTGKGTVSGSGSYLIHTNAVITATPSPGSYFSGWSGDITEEGYPWGGPTNVFMNENKTCTATFVLSEE